MPTLTRKTRTFQELVAKYPQEVQTLARQTRAFVLEQLPSAQESVDASGPYVGYGYAAGYKGTICTIIVSKGGVKLGIVGGASLPDPHGLLEGSGKVHRHIALTSASDLGRPGVKPLLRAALKRWQMSSR